MKKLFVILIGLFIFSHAADLSTTPAPNVKVARMAIEAEPMEIEAQSVFNGPTTTPPWLQLDPPWETNVQVPDFFNSNDKMVSMAAGPDGKIYVAFSPVTNQSPQRYGTGIAWSTDQGTTWLSMVYYSATASAQANEIAVTEDGKIYLWGSFTNATYTNIPCLTRSRIGYYNRPDTLAGWKIYNIPYVLDPECVAWGAGHDFIFVQYTRDHTASDSILFIWSGDSTATGSTYYAVFTTPGGNPEKTTIAVDVIGTDTILTHGIEYYDATGSDWDVVCYLDTLNGSGNLYGWSTSNTLDDRYPSVFANQGFDYFALQSDVGSGNLDIIFNYSTDYGQTWGTTLQDIAPEPEPEMYPRVSGFYSNVGVDYFFNTNYVRFNYSTLNGQSGSWQTSAEFVTNNASANTGYHGAGLVYTPSYYYASWEDLRTYSTDSIDIYAARRVTPIGVVENKSHRVTPALRVSPNPLRDRTNINFILAQTGSVDLSVFDAAGRIVKNLIQARAQAGNYTFAWDRTDNSGRSVQSGVYFCRLTTTQGSSATNLIVVP